MRDVTESELATIIAHGIDEEPIESNKRLFVGVKSKIITCATIFYAAFHMFALNGISLSGMTGGLFLLIFFRSFQLELGTSAFHILLAHSSLVFFCFLALHFWMRKRSRVSVIWIGLACYSYCWLYSRWVQADISHF